MTEETSAAAFSSNTWVQDAFDYLSLPNAASGMQIVTIKACRDRVVGLSGTLIRAKEGRPSRKEAARPAHAILGGVTLPRIVVAES